MVVVEVSLVLVLVLVAGKVLLLVVVVVLLLLVDATMGLPGGASVDKVDPGCDRLVV